MVCPRCGTAFEGRFCPMCGTAAAPPLYLCPRCGTPYTGYACPTCGTPLGAFAPPAVYAPPGSGLRSVGSVVWSLGIITFLVLVALNFAAFIYTVELIVSGALAGGPRYIDLYVLTPFATGERFDVSAEVFLAYFGLLAAVVFAAHGWHGLRDGPSLGRAFLKPIADLRARVESRSAWIAVGQVFMAVMFIQIVYILGLDLSGFTPTVPTSSQPLPSWYPYYLLTNASVYEEFVARWMLVGVPLFAAAVIRAYATKAASPFRGSWRHLVGGTLNRDSPRSLVMVAGVLLVGSSIVFGLAHYPAWGLWKVLPSAIAGFGMGYLFVRHGLFAAILFHFTNDYLGAVVLLTEANLGAQILLGLLIFVIVGFGLFFATAYLLYAIRLANHLAVRWGWKPARPAVAAPSPPPMAWGTFGGRSPGPTWPTHGSGGAYAPPPPPPPPFLAASGPTVPASPTPTPARGWTFVCEFCGWREARFEEGRFTCLRCSRVS